MKLIKLMFFLVIVAILSSCSTIDYVGESYPQTSHADIFFDKADIQKKYKVMGKAIAIAGEFESTQELQRELIARAMEEGADAVLVNKIEKIKTGEESNWDEFGYEESKRKKKHHRRKSYYGQSGSSSTQYKTTTEIKASFLKYK